ncbi:hypothetical protein SAMN05660653_01098 [Desulfonatronum thiosulfatophilum]|uniref:Transposase DDE domain-containing protein n=1 Tax=Desulfonatronum thiosulfatophilum TaxID=617002 RepID=A0A1G6BPI4_9BACT|nr:hypothetical protein [Desulfonatronum thiosulfatophilum]SDB22554.1 hypothetical protein SAMN05660653_01098 [Desulfonatronum thiosulfatophilum]
MNRRFSQLFHFLVMMTYAKLILNLRDAFNWLPKTDVNVKVFRFSRILAEKLLL